MDKVFTKSLAAASATNIAASQTPGAGPILINGSASNFLSTTASAAVAPGGTVIPVASVAGLVPGQPVLDTTSGALVNAVVIGVGTTSVVIYPPVGGTGVGSGDTIVFGGVATLDTGRRVVITSGGNDSGITFTVTGTNEVGQRISDTFAGGNIAAASSNLDFVTVTSITHTGSVASTVTVGTGTTGSSAWTVMNWRGAPPENISVAVELVSGTATFTVEYTLDDPNYLQGGATFPLPIASTITGSATTSGVITQPVVALRNTISAGTGTLRTRVTQADVG